MNKSNEEIIDSLLGGQDRALLFYPNSVPPSEVASSYLAIPGSEFLLRSEFSRSLDIAMEYWDPMSADYLKCYIFLELASVFYAKNGLEKAQEFLTRAAADPSFLVTNCPPDLPSIPLSELAVRAYLLSDKHSGQFDDKPLAFLTGVYNAEQLETTTRAYAYAERAVRFDKAPNLAIDTGDLEVAIREALWDNPRITARALEIGRATFMRLEITSLLEKLHYPSMADPMGDLAVFK